MRRQFLSMFFSLLLPALGFTQDSLSFTQQEIVYGHKHGMGLTMIVVKPSKPNGKAIISIISGDWFSSYDFYPRALNRSKVFSSYPVQQSPKWGIWGSRIITQGSVWI